MRSNTNWSEVDGGANTLVQAALERLPGAGAELTLDFSGVRRVDPGVLRRLEELAEKAREVSVRVVLHGVTAEVYKALKLAAVATQFSFVN